MLSSSQMPSPLMSFWPPPHHAHSIQDVEAAVASRMSLQPHPRTGPGPLHTPQPSYSPTQSSSSSQMPSPSSSAVQHTRMSSTLPAQSQAPSFLNVRAATSVDGAWNVDAAFVRLAHARVVVVANAVAVLVRREMVHAPKASTTLPSQIAFRNVHIRNRRWHSQTHAVHALPKGTSRPWGRSCTPESCTADSLHDQFPSSTSFHWRTLSGCLQATRASIMASCRHRQRDAVHLDFFLLPFVAKPTKNFKSGVHAVVVGQSG